MKHRFLMITLTASVMFMPSCKSTDSTQAPAPEPEAARLVVEEANTDEPLLLEDEPLLLEDEPLLLDDEPLLLAEEPLDDESDDSGADNSRCHVCHINYTSEEIAAVHAQVGIGCARCHGESDEHIADESWASGGNGTAPDIMYVQAKINPFCMECHTKEKLLMPQHETVFSTGDQQKVCTDCHGKHRLSVRRCKWK